MTSINASLSGGYYELSGSNTKTDKNLTKTSTQILVDTLSATPTYSNNDAYSLNLSPAAQSYLSTGTSASVGTPSGKEVFQLSQEQYDRISDVIDKYKDAPYTQDTFKLIQDDLRSQGLDANTLKLSDQVKSFNSTGLLIGYLSGNFSVSSGVPDSATQNTKADNYIKGIINQWQKNSSTYAVTAAGGASDA